MPWYVRLLHMHGGLVGLLDRAVPVDGDGKVQGPLTVAEHARCEQFPDVFQFRKGPEDALSPAVPAALEVPLPPAVQAVEALPEPEEPVATEPAETPPVPAPTPVVEVPEDAPAQPAGPKPGLGLGRRKKKQ